jgi:hypothetical protein
MQHPYAGQALTRCGNNSVMFLQPVVQHVSLQDVRNSSTAGGTILLAFAGMVEASISHGRFEGNALGSILLVQGNASLVVNSSVFSSNSLSGSCIRTDESSILHVEHTAFASNIAYTQSMDGGAVLRVAGDARAALNACSLVNSTATTPHYSGDPALSIRWGGAAHVTQHGRLAMQSCVLQDNTANYGGSVWAGESSQVGGS